MTTSTIATSTITVDTADLLALLRDVREAASSDGVVPMIAGVMLHSAVVDDKPRLVATATDRFCALQGSVAAIGMAPGRLFLANDQISQVVSTLRPYASRKRVGTAQTTITVTDADVRFEQVSLHVLAAVTITLPRNQRDDFPKMGKLFRDAQAKPGSDEPFHVDPAKLVVFARIAARNGRHLSVHAHGAKSAVVARLADDLLGILMPINSGADRTAPMDMPVHDIPVLSEPQEAAA